MNNRIVLVEDDGITIATYGLALVIRSRSIKLTELPTNTQVIIVSGYGASITAAAMHIAVSKHIEVLIAARDRGTMALFAPSPQINASRAALKVREQQFKAVLSRAKTVEAIVSEKVIAEGHERLIEREFLSAVRRAQTTDDVRFAEAKAAQVWWRQWVGFKLSFKGAGVPAEWRVFGKLGELAAQFTARGAVHPMQPC